jgi:hypothetical protein
MQQHGEDEDSIFLALKSFNRAFHGRLGTNQAQNSAVTTEFGKEAA